MKIMRLLLSGGTGFFGKALLRYWFEVKNTDHKPENVFIISRNPQRFLISNPEFESLHWITWITADLRTADPHKVAVNCGGLGQITHVLHAATESTNGPMLSNHEQFSEIVAGTNFMLSLASLIGSPRFLMTSSGGVYGRAFPEMARFREDYFGIPDPLLPKNAYSIAKRTSEHLCALYAEKYTFDYVIARCFAFAGEDLPLNAHFAIGNFIYDALWSDEILVNSDGTAIRSYLDQRDLAKWLNVLLRSGRSGEAYNVGSDCAISIADLAYLVRDLMSPNKPVRILGSRVDNGERSRYVPDISKIGIDLGLSPSVTLEQTILFMAERLRAKAGVSRAT